MQKIRFFYHDRHPVFKDKKMLKQFVESIFLREKKKMENISKKMENILKKMELKKNLRNPINLKNLKNLRNLKK